MPTAIMVMITWSQKQKRPISKSVDMLWASLIFIWKKKNKKNLTVAKIPNV